MVPSPSITTASASGTRRSPIARRRGSGREARRHRRARRRASTGAGLRVRPATTRCSTGRTPTTPTRRARRRVHAAADPRAGRAVRSPRCSGATGTGVIRRSTGGPTRSSSEYYAAHGRARSRGRGERPLLRVRTPTSWCSSTTCPTVRPTGRGSCAAALGYSFCVNQAEEPDDHLTARRSSRCSSRPIAKGGNLLLNVGPKPTARSPRSSRVRCATRARG